MSQNREIYHQRFTEVDRGAKRELWNVLSRHWFSKFIPPDSEVIDLGAGFCEFTNSISCAKKIAIDLNPTVVDYADSNVECIVADLREGLAQLPDEHVTHVVASNVLEHLRDKEYLLELLLDVRRVLKSDGRLIVMQPNYRVVRERFYDFVDHTLPLTEKGMAEALRSTGFKIEVCRARFLPYTTKSRYPAWPLLVRLYLHVPIAQYFMGGQMFVVARKTQDSA